MAIWCSWLDLLMVGWVSGSANSSISGGLDTINEQHMRQNPGVWLIQTSFYIACCLEVHLYTSHPGGLDTQWQAYAQSHGAQ